MFLRSLKNKFEIKTKFFIGLLFSYFETKKFIVGALLNTKHIAPIINLVNRLKFLKSFLQ